MEQNNIKKEIRLIPAYLMLFIWLIFLIFAIGWILLASLSTNKGIFNNQIFSEGLHFENYINAFKEQNVVRYFINSAVYTVSACIGVVVFGAPAAYIMGRYKFSGKTLVNILFISSISLPMLLVVMPMFSLLAKLKITGSAMALVIVYIATNIPFTVFFLTGFFASIPKELEESALIDGCGQLKAFVRIIMPMAQPGIITVTIFNFMVIWNEYFWALIFSTNDNIRTLALGLQVMIQNMRYIGDYPGMFAAVVIIFVPTFLLYIPLSGKIIAGVTVGAVKG